MSQSPSPVSNRSTSSPELAANGVRLNDITAVQWKAGAAAWLGWMFDGLDLHLYTLVATSFVAELMGPGATATDVQSRSSWIQAGFLIGWALGGAFFGRVGDVLGRSRALVLTILTYALFTGLGFFATSWEMLLVFRFLAALGIGGEWAVGASLLAETWPRAWRPWLAAVLQTAVNLGILLASVACGVLATFGFPDRYVFLVGILPAFVTLWIRKAVPETEAWEEARQQVAGPQPRVIDLFNHENAKTTTLTILVCALSLTGHWAIMFWLPQHFNHDATVQALGDVARKQFVAGTMAWMMVASIVGNFVAAGIAQLVGYRRTIALMCLAYALSTTLTFYQVRSPFVQAWMVLLFGVASGLFGLFTMYLPPLFPTLLRTTGAGFSYNIGRIISAMGTVYFAKAGTVGDYRWTMLLAGGLFVPAALVAWFMPDKTHDDDNAADPEAPG